MNRNVGFFGATVEVLYLDGPYKGKREVPRSIIDDGVSAAGYEYQWNQSALRWEAYYVRGE
jgi:hypothetical protein